MEAGESDPRRRIEAQPAGEAETRARGQDLSRLDDLEAELAELESSLQRIDDGVSAVEVPRDS